MRVLSCLATEHNLWLVLLAAGICISGCWVAFDLIQRARDREGLQKSGWIFMSSVAGGASIWCTHFVAMLAYDPQAPVSFSPILTLISLLVAIAGCGAGVTVALSSSDKFVRATGGAVIGAGVAAMHYTGMAAYHVDGLVTWEPLHIAASLLLSVLLSAAATHKLLGEPGRRGQVLSVALFVSAIVALHFTGMAALSVVPMATGASLFDQAALQAMAVAVAGVGLIIVATGVASYLIDSFANLQTVQRLEELALNDPLTGLPNRISFNNQIILKLTRASQTNRKVAVLGIDLNRFKEINDLRGHDAGDTALRLIGARLKGLVADGEFVARIGGDEFGASKIYSDHAELAEFVSRVETALFQPLVIDTFAIANGASIGVAIYPHDGHTHERLISNADLAMYRAKSDSIISVCYYEPTMDEIARDRRNLAIDLRSAIERNELQLHYQVQKSIADGEISGYEVLLRWTHPTRGNVPPSEFIPLAEETGSIVAIGDWVLRTACEEAARWSTPHKIAVNISPAQLAHIDLAARVFEILLETDLAPSRLELEITETTIIQDKLRTLDQLRRIQGFGVTVALDDFGTGYSSLDTLRSFPFDKIKLDRSFMGELENDPQATAIVRAVLALGKSLDIPVLAEGVETSEQLSTLKLEGCKEAQGYLLGRPGAVGDTVHRAAATAPARGASEAA
jgi:diguanylate cyclase